MNKKRLLTLFLVFSLLLLLLPGDFASAEESEEVTGSEAQVLSNGSMSDRLEAIFTTEELLTATIEELCTAMENGTLTSVQLTQMYLDRIAAYDQALGLNSMITLNENALAEAAAADEARANGETGLLLGIPILVKDNIKVAGMPTTNGHVGVKKPATEDAASVAALRAQGAVFLGKTNMSTDAQSGYCSRSGAGGRVHNAYDLSRTPAGSSGGSAVATTSCFCAAALGSDTGSSIRRPSCFANLYGLRPTYDLVSRKGLTTLSKARDTVGPMCRYAEDTVLLLSALTGDSSYNEALSDATLAGKRIGILANSFGWYYNAVGAKITKPTEADPLLQEMYERALTALESAGAELVDLSNLLPERTIQKIGYSSRLNYRKKISALLEENDIDAVLYMSQWGLPLPEKKASDYYDSNADYINIFGPLCGFPEITLPMGLSAADPDRGYGYGLAMGLNLFSAYGNDALVLELAYAYEQAGDWRVSPWTTPALPDESLELFAQTLRQTLNDLNETLYTAESVDAFRSALEGAEALRMRTAEELVAEVLGTEVLALNEEDTRQPVTVSEYYAALETAARAYDALETIPRPEPEPEPEPEQAEPETPEISKESPVGELPARTNPTQRYLTIAVVLLVVLFAAVAALLVYRKKYLKDT